MSVVLGIETSCDETGVGVVRDGVLLGDALASSMAEHARFGGGIEEGRDGADVRARVALEGEWRHGSCPLLLALVH